jgi:8-oxo-dGTP pyrophosphatase MutT (NUDIX family)
MNLGNGTFQEVIRRLEEAFARRLPGGEAQLRMAPRPRPGWDPGRIPDGVRDAAALVLLYPGRSGAPHLVLTVRRDDLPNHAGQVSLPGGEIEAGESFETAAIREAEEEVGVEAPRVRTIGVLSSLHIPVSGFVLHPIVGCCNESPDLRPADAEVARILRVPLRDLLNRDRVRIQLREREGREFEVPYFEIDGETVWGATAMIVAELLWILDCPPDPWGDARTG